MSEKNRPVPVKKKSISAKKRRAREARRRKLRKQRIVCRTLLSILTLLAVIIFAVFHIGDIAFNGPSQTVGDLLTVSFLETSALKFLPRLFYNEDKITEIRARNTIQEQEGDTDVSMIVIATPTPIPTPVPETVTVTVTPEPTKNPNLISSEDGIELYDVRGGTYVGKMLVVQDPSRVSVGVHGKKFSKSTKGLQVYEIAERYNAIAALNGGGFEDVGGGGTGGMPIGLVVSEGKVLHKNDAPKGVDDIVVGFTNDNILIMGRFSAEQAKEKGIRDAVTFGPALVFNGEGLEVSGSSSGLNPRSAIGQRADGAVLLLVIDGRQASSIGATYADEVAIMLEYGAVNACNLDGGSSAVLYYNGRYVNNGVELTGSRKLPTAFIVR